MIAFAHIQYQELPVRAEISRKGNPSRSGRNHLSAGLGGNENTFGLASEAIGIAKLPDKLPMGRIIEPAEALGKGRRGLFCGRGGNCYTPILGLPLRRQPLAVFLGQPVEKLLQGFGGSGKMRRALAFLRKSIARCRQKSFFAIIEAFQPKPCKTQFAKIGGQGLLFPDYRGANAYQADKLTREGGGLSAQGRHGCSEQHGGTYGPQS